MALGKATAPTFLLITLVACLRQSIVAFRINVGRPSFYSSLSSSTADAIETDFKAPVAEIDRRRNLAIISHPDSGKTTMTEKLLLYGGALQQAGAVRQKAEQRATQSDFMELEQERGISISSTVMNFEYQGYGIRLMDTPGK